VILSPWVTHRRADLWPDPHRFNPDRFESTAAANRHRYAYFPFAAGVRGCIGEHHRRGFAGSTRPPGPPSTEDPADDAVGLLNHLGIDRAHVVGHSYGAMIALSLAATHPTRVRSLTLLEIPAFAGPAGTRFADGMASLTQRYAEGDATFGLEQAAAIACPVLSVLGTASAPLFAEGRAQLHRWFPQCQNADITGATHHLQMQAPGAVAAAIAAFLRNQVAARLDGAQGPRGADTHGR
jgi:pimeloyl-ACP methyl ester carboxylesterase